MVKIDSTKFGEVTIDGKTYYSDVTVFWDGKIDFRQKEHVIDLDEFMQLLARKLDILIVGTGQVGVVDVSRKVREIAEDRKVKIIELKTPYAIEVFNAYASQGKKVIAVLHTTC